MCIARVLANSALLSPFSLIINHHKSGFLVSQSRSDSVRAKSLHRLGFSDPILGRRQFYGQARFEYHHPM
jgi:hypothetical protein